MEDDKKKKRRKPVFLVVVWVVIAVLALSGVTYAWFSFNSSTNVEPMGSTVSDGDASLLISTNAAGPFANTCTLTLSSHSEALKPVSTDNLTAFYASAAQDTNGITLLYTDVTSDIDDYTMRGTLYLEAQDGDLDVYFMKQRMSFGSNVQGIAASRLGLQITVGGVTTTYIFRLDNMLDVTGATSTVTITSPGSIVSSITNGAANYVTDVARNINDYSATATSADDTEPTAGTNALFTLTDGQVATVEYWLYLEGCDENCINDVQNKDMALQLSFAGVER